MEVKHECVPLDVLREWLTTGRGSLHESSKDFLKKIGALEYLGLEGHALVLVEREEDRLIQFRVLDSITILETLHS